MGIPASASTRATVPPTFPEAPVIPRDGSPRASAERAESCAFCAVVLILRFSHRLLVVRFHRAVRAVPPTVHKISPQLWTHLWITGSVRPPSAPIRRRIHTGEPKTESSTHRSVEYAQQLPRSSIPAGDHGVPAHNTGQKPLVVALELRAQGQHALVPHRRAHDYPRFPQHFAVVGNSRGGQSVVDLAAPQFALERDAPRSSGAKGPKARRRRARARPLAYRRHPSVGALAQHRRRGVDKGNPGTASHRDSGEYQVALNEFCAQIVQAATVLGRHGPRVR